MLRKVRKLGAVIMALTMIFVLSLGAGAAYYKMPAKADVDGTVIGDITEDSVTVSVEITPGSAKSINFYLEGDALTSEFWNQPDAAVEVDISMSTDGDLVYACLPGFTSGWGWVNPTDWNGLLAKGQTTTVRETFSTYYSGGFGSKEPMALRVQLYTNSSETQNVEVTVHAPRFVGVGDVAEVTTTVATTTTAEPEETTTAPEETEAPVEDEPADEPVDEPTESETVEEPTESEPAEDEPAESEPEDTTAATTTSKPEEDDTDRPITTTTQPSQTTASTTSAATTSVASNDSGDSFAGPIIIIIIAVVVIAGAAVGFIIYRKKKFY